MDTHLWEVYNPSDCTSRGCLYRHSFKITKAMSRKRKYKLTEDFFQKRVEAYLISKGWDHNLKSKGLREHGCDIVVSDGNNKNKARRFYIEAKGRSYARSARSIADTNFLFALGQLVTRMSVIACHTYKYGLALPEERAKIALRRIPWQVARHLCLSIFSVDDHGEVVEYSPKDFKKFNVLKK